MGGLLLHWNGHGWSESFPAAQEPVRAIQGLAADGDLFLVLGGQGIRMVRQGTIKSSCPSLHQLRDLVGPVGERDLVRRRRWRGPRYPETGCQRVSDTPGFGVWGDGRDRLVVASHANAVVTLLQREGEGWKSLGSPSAAVREAPSTVPMGKALTGDRAGRLFVLLQPEAGHAVLNPFEHTFTVTWRPDGEQIFGLAAVEEGPAGGGPGQGVAFVGARGCAAASSGRRQSTRDRYGPISRWA